MIIIIVMVIIVIIITRHFAEVNNETQKYSTIHTTFNHNIHILLPIFSFWNLIFVIRVFLLRMYKICSWWSYPFFVGEADKRLLWLYADGWQQQKNHKVFDDDEDIWWAALSNRLLFLFGRQTRTKVRKGPRNQGICKAINCYSHYVVNFKGTVTQKLFWSLLWFM